MNYLGDGEVLGCDHSSSEHFLSHLLHNPTVRQIVNIGTFRVRNDF